MKRGISRDRKENQESKGEEKEKEKLRIKKGEE